MGTRGEIIDAEKGDGGEKNTHVSNLNIITDINNYSSWRYKKSSGLYAKQKQLYYLLLMMYFKLTRVSGKINVCRHIGIYTNIL